MALLMGLAALGAGLGGWRQGKDDAQQREARELQMENTRLRNEGLGYDNSFKGETFGFRLDQERGNADYEMGRGRTALATARQEEEIENKGLRVGQEAEKLNYERNRANYWGHTATEAASNARVAVDTEGSRARTLHSNAEKAYQEAVRAGVTTRSEAAKHIGNQVVSMLGDRSLQEGLGDDAVVGAINAQLEIQFDDLLSEGQRIERLIYDEGVGGYMVATRMPDGSIKPITQNRSSDPNDPVQVFSPEEVEGIVLGDSVDEYRTAEAQRRGAGNIVRQEVEAAHQGHVDTVRATGQQRVDVQAARGAIPALSELGGERTRLAGRIHALEKQKTTGFGSASINAPLNEQISELQSELEVVNTRLDDLRNTHGSLVELAPEELDEIDQQLAGQLSGQGDQWRQTLRDIGGASQEARRVATASGGDISPEDATRNITGRAPSLAALSPAERLEQQASVTKSNDTITAAVNDTFENAVSTFEDSVNAIELKQRGFAQEDVSRALRSAQAAMFNSEGHTDLVSAASGSARERLGVQVLLGLALEDAIDQGGDVSTYIAQTLANKSPAAISMASQFANDEAFAGVDDGTRLQTVDRAVELMELENLNATQAKTRALQEMNARN